MSFEVRVDDWVLGELKRLGVTYYQQNDLPENYIKALQGASKSGNGTGRPDFTVSPKDSSKVAVIIEDKYGLEFLESKGSKGELLTDPKSINNYALNGAIHYATKMVESKHFNEVYAVGIAGEGEKTDLNKKIKVYLVRESLDPKFIETKSLNHFSDATFKKFHKENKMTEDEKHKLLEANLSDLKKYAKDLNVIFNNNAVSVESRSIYVSGMLLAMKNDLTPDSLLGKDHDSKHSDGKLIYDNIEDYLIDRKIPESKRKMMISSFNIIRNDPDKDIVRNTEITVSGKAKAKRSAEMSINKELFTFIYENIYSMIEDSSHLDTLGELYSEFLKYATGDGGSNGVVLTPPYVTKLMTQLIDVNVKSKVADLCTGSAGFLVSAMATMLEQAKDEYEDPKDLAEVVKSIKETQLLGVEYSDKMFTLASTNMILRGDGSSQLHKGDSFQVVPTLDYKATHVLLNPPFSYNSNGMPFLTLALNMMERGGKAGIIIQDSAGTGKAIKTNKEILENNTLLASIKMPADLFQPNAGVQTSIYIVEAGIPHDYKKTVKFIDFSNDGYKRTKRGTRNIDNAELRYEKILEIYNYGKRAEGYEELGIEYIEDVITDSGSDWNYTQHRIVDTTPTKEDFLKVVGDHLMWEVKQLLGGVN